jgi:hypothetical protein
VRPVHLLRVNIGSYRSGELRFICDCGIDRSSRRQFAFRGSNSFLKFSSTSQIPNHGYGSAGNTNHSWVAVYLYSPTEVSQPIIENYRVLDI